jgi:N-acetyl-gamma-glutamylphosphate reductase
MGTKSIRVGIVGGTGYTGVELLRLLSQHPHCELAVITSRKEAGLPVADMFPNLRGTSRSSSASLRAKLFPPATSFSSPLPTASR